MSFGPSARRPRMAWTIQPVMCQYGTCKRYASTTRARLRSRLSKASSRICTQNSGGGRSSSPPRKPRISAR